MEVFLLILIVWLAYVVLGRTSRLLLDVEEMRRDLHAKDKQIQTLTSRLWLLEQRAPVEDPAPFVSAPIPAAAVEAAVEAEVKPPPPAEPEPQPEPAIPEPSEPLEPAPPVEVPPVPDQPLPEPKPPRDWEAIIGTSILNAAGVLILVIGLSLLLGYTLTQVGPAGKIAIGLLSGIAMIGAGMAVERRDRYLIFGRGLIAGGWAVVYFTAYAAHALPAARVIQSPFVGGFVVLLAASGMILHSLRYRSQYLTMVAFLAAYAALQIAPLSAMSMSACVPLTIALLAIARSMGWSLIPLAGIVLCYFTVAFRFDAQRTGVAAGAAALYGTWLAFEFYDLSKLRAAHARQLVEYSIFPLNAFLFLGTSFVTLPPSNPLASSNFLGSIGVMVLVSSVLRLRWGASYVPADKRDAMLAEGWRFGIPLAAALFAGAIMKRFDGAQAMVALLMEAQLFVLAGSRSHRLILHTGGAVFAFAAIVYADINGKPHWLAPVFSAQLYFNRWLSKNIAAYSYGGTALLLYGSAVLLPDYWFCAAWVGIGLALAEVYVRTRWTEFRHQALGATALGVLAGWGWSAAQPEKLRLMTTLDAVSAALAYGVALRLRSAGDRLGADLATVGGTTMAAWAIWIALPAPLIALGWALLGLVLLERGLHVGSSWLRVQAHLLLFGSFVRLFFANLPVLTTTAGVSHRLLTVTPLIGLAVYCWRRLSGVEGRAYSYAATVLALALLHFELGRTLAALGWGGLMLALTWFGMRQGDRDLKYQAYGVAALTFLRSWATNFNSPNLSIMERLALGLAVIAMFHAAQFLLARGDRARMAFSLGGTALLAMVLFEESSGRTLTIAWGAQAIVTIVAGFGTQERILRLSGLALFAICILKLFFYDLSELDTLGRIVSFIVLGLVLISASAVYMRFKDKIQQYL